MSLSTAQDERGTNEKIQERAKAGKAKALRLGIVKGVKHTVAAVLPKTWHCPICKMEFNAYDVALQAKTEGIDAEDIVAGHVKDCIASRFPNQKSDCYFCHKKGKTTKLLISELDAHFEKEHSDEISESSTKDAEVEN